MAANRLSEPFDSKIDPCVALGRSGPPEGRYRASNALKIVAEDLTRLNLQSRGLRSIWSTAPAVHYRRRQRVKGTPRLRRGRRPRRRPLTRLI